MRPRNIMHTYIHKKIVKSKTLTENCAWHFFVLNRGEKEDVSSHHNIQSFLSHVMNFVARTLWTSSENNNFLEKPLIKSK